MGCVYILKNPAMPDLIKIGHTKRTARERANELYTTSVPEPMVRGWQLSQHLTQSLTLRPLQQALRQSVPEIHHSDQGVQYLSTAYISILTCHGIEISLAHRGRPWENGNHAERLIRTLKEEEVLLNEYDDIMQAKARIGILSDTCITRNALTRR